MVDNDLKMLETVPEEEITDSIHLDRKFARDLAITGSFRLSSVEVTALGRLLNALPTPALLVDPSHTIFFANEACEMLGLHTGQVKGLQLSVLFPSPEDSARARALVSEVFSSRRPLVGEGLLGTEKNPIWGRMHLRSLKVEGKRSVLMLVEDLTYEKQQLLRTEEHKEELRKARDDLERRVEQRTAELVKANEQLRREIHQRTRIETKLRQSEEMYRAVVEDQTELICRFLRDGRLTFVNEAYCRYFDRTREELVGMNFLALVPPEHRDARVRHLRSLTTEHPVAIHEHGFVNRQGLLRWQQWTDRAIFDASGNVVEFQSVGRDITELKQTYEELARSRERLRYMLSSSPAVIYTCRPEGDFVITFVSDNVRNLVGCEPAELTKASSFWGDRVHPDDAPRVWQSLASLLKEGHRVQEYRFLHADGKYRWMRDETKLVLDSEGNPAELVGSWIDITNLKTAEDQLRATIREKEVLLKEIHHRVKNNLQIMSSLLDLQTEDIKDERYIGIFKDAESRIWSMALIHEELYRSNLAQIAVGEYIQALADDLFNSHGVFAKGVTIQIDVESNDICLGIDTAVPFGLILNELLSNALKHAFPGGRKGTIRVALKRVNRDELELSIGDDGVGFKGDLELKQGSFGLRLVHNLVSQLKGTLWLDETREGTTFRMRFTSPSDGKRGHN